MKKKNCPVCEQPMMWFENPGRWKCVNIKAHDARASERRGFRGHSIFRRQGKGGKRKNGKS
jgi:hypothetical protein